MIIIQISGGLGNQLQQYALYRKFRNLKKECKLDVSLYIGQGEQNGMLKKRRLELDFFLDLPYEICTDKEKKNLIGLDNFWGKVKKKLFPNQFRVFEETEIYHPEILQFSDMYIKGYFACEKYYADILEDLRKLIQFPDSNNPLNKEMANRMYSTTSVSIHIRRGDYLEGVNRKMFGDICTDVYYKKSIEYMKKHLCNPYFYIFSDDVLYAKNQFQGDEYIIVDINHGEDSFYDMWLMSQCKHHICANSTFSFWGARLNSKTNKIMIRPTIHKNSQKFEKNEMLRLWNNWVFISPNGEMYE